MSQIFIIRNQKPSLIHWPQFIFLLGSFFHSYSDTASPPITITYTGAISSWTLQDGLLSVPFGKKTYIPVIIIIFTWCFMVCKAVSHVPSCTFASITHQTFLITNSQLLETVQEAMNNLEEQGHYGLKTEKCSLRLILECSLTTKFFCKNFFSSFSEIKLT